MLSKTNIIQPILNEAKADHTKALAKFQMVNDWPIFIGHNWQAKVVSQ